MSEEIKKLPAILSETPLQNCTKSSIKLSFVSALCWIILSTLIISGGSYKVFKIYVHSQDHAARLLSIVQTSPQREALKTAYLAELMNLSVDHPIKLHSFDLKEARRALLQSPVIKEASLRLLPPHSLYVDYVVRQPLAWIHDYENSAVDEEGSLFPVSPFFSPKQLPEIYLGLPDASIGKQGEHWPSLLNNRELKLAFSLYEMLDASKEHGFRTLRIDVSNAYAESFGKREIVVLLENKGISRHFLRLSTKNYLQEFSNYLNLRKTLYRETDKAQEMVIDLRLPQLGFIERIPS